MAFALHFTYLFVTLAPPNFLDKPSETSFESFRSEMKSKTLVFALHFTHLFVTLHYH